MPVVQAYPLGVSMHTPSTSVARPGKRGAVRGWSRSAAARHVRFLQSVDVDQLHGFGYAVTLTVRDIPESATGWTHSRERWLQRMRRFGMVRFHWVTEWQRRGAPHLHAACYFERELSAGERLDLVRAWLDVTAEYGSQIFGQRVERLKDAAAWGRYCAKHSARSSSHAQRQGMPPGWEKSGRLWGQGGDWPVAVERFAVDLEGFHQMRRLVRSWRVADARAEKDPETRQRRELLAKRCLRRGVRASSVWGMREWAPRLVTRQMIVWLIREGYNVRPITDDEPAAEETQAYLVAV